MQYFINLLFASFLLSFIGCGQDEGKCPRTVVTQVDETNEANTDTTETGQDSDSDLDSASDEDTPEPDPNESEDEVATDEDGLCDGPQAIGQIADCQETGTTNCDTISTQPLERVYLDGSRSYDPSGGTIVNYQWDVTELPATANPSAFDWSGTSSSGSSLLMPTAGNYRVCLTVFNDSGITHCNTEGNCVEIVAE